ATRRHGWLWPPGLCRRRFHPRIKTVASVSAILSMTVPMARIWGLPSRNGWELEGSTIEAAKASAGAARRGSPALRAQILALFPVACTTPEPRHAVIRQTAIIELASD